MHPDWSSYKYAIPSRRTLCPVRDGSKKIADGIGIAACRVMPLVVLDWEGKGESKHQ
jgi:hypothetical protein